MVWLTEIGFGFEFGLLNCEVDLKWLWFVFLLYGFPQAVR
jgi:hypothetical protein